MQSIKQILDNKKLLQEKYKNEVGIKLTPDNTPEWIKLKAKVNGLGTDVSMWARKRPVNKREIKNGSLKGAMVYEIIVEKGKFGHKDYMIKSVVYERSGILKAYYVGFLSNKNMCYYRDIVDNMGQLNDKKSFI